MPLLLLSQSHQLFLQHFHLSLKGMELLCLKCVLVFRQVQLLKNLSH